MNHIIVILFVTGLIGYFYNEYKKEKKEDKRKVSTRQLLRDTLNAMGCPYKIDNDDDFVFEYQGDNFVISATDNELHRNIVIRNPWWCTMDINNNDVPLLKAAVNECNITCVPTTVYTISEEYNKIAVHSQLNFNFNEERGNHTEIFKMYLNSFIEAHHEVANKFQQMKQEQVTLNERKVIKGFSQNVSS